MSFRAFTYDQIEAYLNGEMSSEERIAFEKELSANKTLSDQVEKHKLANALILENRLLAVKNILAEERLKTEQKISYKKYVYAALALAIAIGATVAVFVYSGKNKKEGSQSPEESTVQNISDGGTLAGGEKINAGTAATAEKTYQESTPEPTYLRKQDVQLIEEKHQLNKDVISAKVSADTGRVLMPVYPGKDVESDETKDICAATVIKADIKTSATCLHEAAGNVLVYNIHGGTKPYTVSMLNAHKEAVFNGELEKGIYQVRITDKNGCEKIYPSVEIAEKDCPKDYSFNPFIGETWVLEPYHAAGKMELYNKGGILYYQTNIDANVSNEWTGTGLNNQILPGYYIFVVKYADGTSKKGSVTIVQ